MQWLIQNSGVTFAALDRNVAPLVAALDELRIPKFAIGYIPFTEIITGLDNIDPTIPTIFYGSTRVAELAKNLNYKPGAFYNNQWFDPAFAAANRSDMLNQENRKITVGELRESWTNEPIFVKSVDPKQLTGMVLEGTERDIWTEEYSHLENSVELVVSPIQNIIREWRFFIVGGTVVAGSHYKEYGVTRTKIPIPKKIWDVAKSLTNVWLPNENIVMDICELSTGEFKVVEYNALNSSGFYNCDCKAIVMALENMYNK